MSRPKKTARYDGVRVAESPRKTRSIIFFVAINILSLICLVWALHGINFGLLWDEIEHLRWGWIAAGIAVNLFSYVIQAWRWRLVLAPVTPVPLRETLRAVFVGTYANEVLPLRSGEIIRCYLLARCRELPISVTLASALIERIFDGIWLVAAMIFTLRVSDLPGFIKDSGIFLAALLLVCAILLAVAMFWKEQALDAVLGARWLGWVHVLIKDLHLIGHSRFLYYAFFLSLPFLLLQVFPIYAVMHAYDGLNHLPVVAALTVAIMLRFNSVLPQAPGNVGTFPAAAIIGLRPFRRLVTSLPPVPRLVRRRAFETMAQNFSIILLAVLTIPLLVVGFIAVALTGMNIGDIHRGAKKSMSERSKPPQDRPHDRVA